MPRWETEAKCFHGTPGMASRESALRRRAAPPLHASAGSARLERTKKREMHGSLKEAGRQNLTESLIHQSSVRFSFPTVHSFREKAAFLALQGRGCAAFSVKGNTRVFAISCFHLSPYIFQQCTLLHQSTSNEWIC